MSSETKVAIEITEEDRLLLCYGLELLGSSHREMAERARRNRQAEAAANLTHKAAQADALIVRICREFEDRTRQ